MALTMTAKRGNTSGYPLRFRAVALTRRVKNIGKVVIKWRVRRLEREAGNQRRDHQPAPPILRFGTHLVRIKNGVCDVVAALL